MREKKLPTYTSSGDPNVRLSRAERDIRMLYRRVIIPIGLYEIKVWADAITVGKTHGTGDGRFIFEIPDDLDLKHLTVARGFVTTVGSTPTVVQVRNVTNGNADMLSTPITIDAGEKSSETSGTPVVIDTADSIVHRDDQISLDVDSNAADSAGLGVILNFE